MPQVVKPQRVEKLMKALQSVNKQEKSLSNLKEYLDYDPQTGQFTWLKTKGKAAKGRIAGCLDVSGYWLVRFNKKNYRAHRLAWYFIYGKFPSQIDHINRNKLDNRLENLRESSQQENRFNSSLRDDCKSKYKGVRLPVKTSKLYQSSIRKDGKVYYLGSFECKKEAALAYNIKAEELFGKFAVFNQVF